MSNIAFCISFLMYCIAAGSTAVGVTLSTVGVDAPDSVAVDSSSNVTDPVLFTRTLVGGGPNDFGIPAIGLETGTGTSIPPVLAIPAAIALVELLGSATMLVVLRVPNG